MSASGPWPSPRVAHCECASACRRSDQSCSCIHLNLIRSRGSINQPRYQLALTMPGISPRMAISRSLLRPSPNLLYTPRGRPVSLQRLRSRVGLELRGSCCSLCRAASRASSESLVFSMFAFSSARFLAYFFTILRRFRSRLTTEVFAMALSVLERELECGEQSLGLGIALRGGRYGDVHPADRVDLVVF